MTQKTVEKRAREATGLQLSYFVATFIPGAVFALPWSLVALGATWLASLETSWAQCYVVAWVACTVSYCADFRREAQR